MPISSKSIWYTYNTSYPVSYIMFPLSGWGGFNTVNVDPIEIDFALPIEKQQKVQNGNAEGYECSECKDFYPMAELNQPENAEEFIRFTCYGCRKGLNTVFENK